MTHNFNRDIEALSKHYGELVQRHGDAPEGAQYADRDTQERRMAVLAEIGVGKDSKVLDFGCGTGQMLTLLQRTMGFEGEYVGYDISPDAIEVARASHRHGRFEVLTILDEPAEEMFDDVLVSGVFNNPISDNRGFFQAISRRLMAQA